MLPFLSEHGVYILHAEWNAVLKLKFQGLHETIVSSVNAVDIVGFLFQEKVLGTNDVARFGRLRQQNNQCSDLLMQLHSTENPQAFVQLYRAIKNLGNFQWLIDKIDNFCDQPVTDRMQQRYTCLTGKRYIVIVITWLYSS